MDRITRPKSVLSPLCFRATEYPQCNVKTDAVVCKEARRSSTAQASLEVQRQMYAESGDSIATIRDHETILRVPHR